LHCNPSLGYACVALHSSTAKAKGKYINKTIIIIMKEEFSLVKENNL
jgi:hypothetical protein